MGRLIGDAFIVIYPQDDGFAAKTEALVKKALAPIKPTVNVRPEIDKSSAAAVEAEIADIGKNATAKIGAVLDPVSLARAKASLDAYMKGENVELGASIDPASLAKAKASLDALLKGSPNLNVSASSATASLTALAARVREVQEDLADMRANVDDTAAEAKLAALQVRAAAITKLLSNVKTDTDLAPIEAKYLALMAAIDKVAAANAKLPEGIDLMDPAVQGVLTKVDALETALTTLKATVNSSDALAKIAALQLRTDALVDSLEHAGAGDSLAPFEAKLLGIQAAYEKVLATQKAEDDELEKQTGLWGSLGLQGPGSLIHITDILNASLPEVRLFGGAFGAMYTAVMGGDKELPALASHLINVATSAHLTAEAGIEVAAIWVPATLALAAFAAAATPTAIEIGKQLNNMNVAATGTGKAFASLATNGTSVVAAVRPSVLEAFGLALFAVQNHASTLSDAMHTLGAGIDQFAAKAAIAFDSNTSSKFFQQGSQDALALLDSFEQLGSILGTLLKVVPGYAEVLLGFGNNLLTIAADAIKVVEPVLQIGVALHGALFYGGLAGTAVALGFSKMVDGAAVGALGIATAAEKILGSESKIGAGALSAGGFLEDLGSGPVILGIGLLAGAIAAVVIYLKASSNEAADFSKTIQSTLKNTAVTALPQTLANDLAQANAKLAASQATYTQAVKDTATANENLASTGRIGEATLLNNDGALQKVEQTMGEYSKGQQQLSAQSQALNLNLGAIAGTFGTSIPGALSLANAAQVTTNQLLTTGSGNWAVISTMIAGYITQLKVMVPGTGALNQALNVLNVTQSQQVTNAQKLASAYTTWIGIVTGGDSAFTSFEQAQQTLVDTLGGKVTPAMVTSTTASTSAKQAIDQLGGTSTTTSKSLTKLASGGTDVTNSLSSTAKGGQDVTKSLTSTTSATTSAAAAADTLSVKVGNITEKFSLAGAAMNGITPAALAARQAFDQQITAAAQLYANLQTMSVVSGSTADSQEALAKAGRDLVAQLLPLAAGSKTATAEVYALAQIAGYQGPDSFQKLATWVGTTKNAEADLNSQTEKLTLSSANLTQAAKDLSAAMQNEVAAGETAAIAKATDLTGIQGQLATAVENSNGKFTTAAITLSGQYYEALIKSGQGATTAQQDVDAFLTKLGATPSTVATVNAALAKLPKTVSVSVDVAVSGTGEISALLNDGLTVGQATKAAEADLLFRASGGTVPGASSNGSDNHLAMVKSGELIIPSQHAPKFRDAARKASIPGFAAGGTVPGLDQVTTALGTLAPFASNAGMSFGAREGTEFATQVITEARNAAATAAAAAAAAINTSGVSNASAMAALQSAAAKAGWTGAEWTALNNIEMREAGYNLSATNPSSGAYGMAQFINGAGEYAQYGGNSTTPAGQAVAMVNYIKSRYGDPESAWAHEQEFGWYKRGGVVRPHSAGGMVSEPVFGQGAWSGLPYSFAERGPEYVGPISGNGTAQAAAGMSGSQAQALIGLMQQQNKLLAQMPYAYSQALQQTNGNGVRRGYFATSG